MTSTSFVQKSGPIRIHVLLLVDLSFRLQVPKDAADLLSANGVSPDEIDTIIYSHMHWDHIVRARTFSPMFVGLTTIIREMSDCSIGSDETYIAKMFYRVEIRQV